MTALLEAAPLIGVLLLGAVGLAASFVVARRNRVSGKRSQWSYLLLWPLILDRDRPEGSGLFTKRELIGWGVLFLLIVLAVTFSP